MNTNTQALYELAQSVSSSGETEQLSVLLEQESRRYSRRLEEEEEARLR